MKADCVSKSGFQLRGGFIMEIYIHIPFCISKCAYCDFLSAPASREEQDRYMRALMNEISLAADSLWKEDGCAAERVTSVFIGGGTPSCIDPEWICRVMTLVKSRFNLTEGAEITMEANPGTLAKESLKVYREAGINRLSIGLQTTDNEELKKLSRIHTYEQFLDNYRLAREAGFDNINIDLMSALPDQTLESYEQTLREVISLKPEHISAYSLIIEEGTPFWDKYADHPELLPDEETDRQMYHRTKELLGGAGYGRYEISNYSLPGRECRHNMGYWRRVPYLGFGLGAASLCDETRFSNTRSMSRYLELLDQAENPQDEPVSRISSSGNTDNAVGSSSGTAHGHGDTDAGTGRSGESLHSGVFGGKTRRKNETGHKKKESADAVLNELRENVEHLTVNDQMSEFMFLGLRMMDGIRSDVFMKKFGRPIETVFGTPLHEMTDEGLMEKTDCGWKLTDWGIDVSNVVLAEFLLD